MRALSAMFSALKGAEEISRDVALCQVSLAPEPKLRRCLEQQARQEAHHARVFEAALRIVSPRVRTSERLNRALAAYRARLDADLDLGRLGESIVGLQCVFEALGEVVLCPVQGGIAMFASRFVPLRGALLQQERMHRRFGCRWLRRLLAADEAAGPRLAYAYREYVEYGEEVLAASVEIFDAFPLDQRRFASDALGAMRSLEDEFRGRLRAGPH